MSWAPTTRATRDGVAPATAVLARCCRRTVQADMILVTPDGDEVCDACVATVARNGGLVDLYTQLGAPPDVLLRIAEKHA